MPIYEFRCNACRRKTSVFVRTVSSEVAGACEHCGGTNLSRLVSRVAVLRGDDGGGFDEGSLDSIDENDPRAMAKWVRKMSREMGEPLDSEMQTELERMEAGEMPSEDFGDGGMEDDFGSLD